MKKCKTCGQSVSNEDRISVLPEALLLKILSLLPTKDVVATSVLAKRWRSVWKMVPNLEFIYIHKKDHERFSDNVSMCLLSHQAPVLQSLSLRVYCGSDSTGLQVRNLDIGILMGIAFGRQLRELVLQVHSWKCFRFPTSLYYCQTLETLELYQSILVDVPSPVCLKSLRTLRLYHVLYKDHDSVVNLLSGCLNLQTLVVHRYYRPDNVTTFTVSVPSLQNLTIISHIDDSEYVINAPCLKYLEILSKNSAYMIENAPELVEARISGVAGIVFENIIGSLTSVKRLFLKIETPLEIKFPTGNIFNQLIYLELRTHKADWWNLLTLMLDTSPKLQVLKLVGDLSQDRKANRKWNQPKNVPECLLLHLETFVWTKYDGEIEDEKEVAKYILKNASRLNKATFSKVITHPKRRFQRLAELESVAMASNSCQLLFN